MSGSEQKPVSTMDEVLAFVQRLAGLTPEQRAEATAVLQREIAKGKASGPASMSSMFSGIKNALTGAPSAIMDELSKLVQGVDKARSYVGSRDFARRATTAAGGAVSGVIEGMLPSMDAPLTAQDIASALDPSTLKTAMNMASLAGSRQGTDIPAMIWPSLKTDPDYQHGKTAGAVGAMAIPVPGGKASKAARAVAEASAARKTVEAAKEAATVEEIVQAANDIKNSTKNVAGTIQVPEAARVRQLIQSGEGKGVFHGTKIFGGITPQRERAIKTRFLKAVEEGKDFRTWYDEVKPELLAMTGGDEVKARQLAFNIAETSAGTEIGVNTGFAVQANNQLAVGDPVKTGRWPARMSENIQRIADNPDEAVTGLKRSAFGHNLDPTVDPMAGDARATHDIRYMRGLGINDPKTGKPWDKGISEAGHAYLDNIDQSMMEEANRRGLGGITDWTLPRMQAAAWIAQKAKQDGVSLAEAAANPNHFWDRYAALISGEAAPGTGLPGLWPEYADAPPDVQAQFTREILSSLQTPEGRNEIATGMGALARPDIEQIGSYADSLAGTTVNNRSMATPIPAGQKAGVTDESTHKLLKGVASLEGLLLGQNQMGVTVLDKLGQTPQSKFSGALLNMGRPVTDAEQASLMATLGKDTPVMKHPLGVAALSFMDPGDPARKPLVSTLRNMAAKFGGNNDSVRLFQNTGDLVPSNAAVPGEGRWASAYLDNIPEGSKMEANATGLLMKEGGVTDRLLSAVQGVQEKYGWSDPPEWYTTMLKTAKSEGVPGIRRLAKMGIIPASAWAMINADLDGGEGDNQ